MNTRAMFSPFPGLRPFEPDEDHLFFGREKEIDELLRRLRQTRFLSVVGTSGSGKSSLVRSGLIPSLYSGFMVGAGSSWRVAVLRPGEDPIGHLAWSLGEADVLGTNEDLVVTNRVTIEATLRRSTLGLTEAVRMAKVPPDENLLIVVDQFEELFRFRRSRGAKVSTHDAGFFVKLLLEASRQNNVRIHVVLTMRSDFVGDCLEFPGLPEAINAGQYLVPRMTRDELRSAITGPVAVGGGTISPRLVLRLLNDVGDDPDQLPVLQHALMRTWDYWSRHDATGPIDIPDYEAIGSMRRALSLHADEAYEETSSTGGNSIAARIFKALTDTSTDSRGARRPTSVQELAAICERPLTGCDLRHRDRRPGRSFLMPPASVPLDSQSIIDVSHESLMRCWTRLIAWAEEERISAAYYARLAQAAAWHQEGTAGLWRDPELELGLAWRRENAPTAAWAKRYNPSFPQAMDFLDRSEAERNRLRVALEQERKKKLRYAWSVSSVLAILLGVALVLGWLASKERTRAETNLQFAKRAVDETLSSAGSDFARVAADVPQMEEFRRELLEKARDFYTQFSNQKPDSEEFRAEISLAHFRLGDIHRLLQQTDAAIEEYGKAIEQSRDMVRDFPRKPEYRQLLANTYNWLGETQRPLARYGPDAEKAYDSALSLQVDLHREFPENTDYQQELARTHYNRGILRSDQGLPDDSDFREAIRLLQPLSESETSSKVSSVRQELARTYNNLGRLLRGAGRQAEARGFYEQAIGLHESLIQREPGNREYKLEIATFCNNLAILLEENGQLNLANERNQQAVNWFEELAVPVPSLALDVARAHSLRGRILESQRLTAEAEREYAQSLKTFEALEGRTNSSEFHLVFGQALFDLAALRREKNDFRGAADLASRAVTQHLAANSQLNLGYDYLLLAQIHLALRAVNDARSAAANLSRLLPVLTEPDKSILTGGYMSLRDKLE